MLKVKNSCKNGQNNLLRRICKTPGQWYNNCLLAWFPTRNQVSIIFQGRTRMLKVKNSCKNGQNNLLCRICKTTEETYPGGMLGSSSR